MKLWEVTAKPKYLALASRLTELRGNAAGHELYLEYDEGRNLYFFQDYRPVKEYEKAYGHGVRALYLYSSMADLGARLGDSAYFQTLKRLWENIVSRKMYITGGIGSRHKGEAFGEDYELPNETAYSETCSSIADILWNYRMFRQSGEAKYMDICERILYNAFLAGWSQSGTEYNYVNPLASDGVSNYNKGHNHRQPWFETSCCPTNIARFVPQIPEMIYAVGEDRDLYVNLFIASETELSIDGRKIQVRQQGEYPWDGKIAITVTPEQTADLKVLIRIPAWTSQTPLPGSDLYRYADNQVLRPTLRVNGKIHPATRLQNGYLAIERTWKAGDRITVDFPMPVREVTSHAAIATNEGLSCLERGPLVYCVEESDNGPLENVHLLSSGKAKPGIADTPGNPGKLLTVIRHSGFTWLPYYAWGNRGANAMKVWIPKR